MNSLIKKWLKELRFRYDLYLPLSRKEFIPIHLLFDDLGCDDEAIICREFRTNFPQFCISEDGQEFYIDSELDFVAIDARTLYVEFPWDKLEPVDQESAWHSQDGSWHFITFYTIEQADQVLASSEWNPIEISTRKTPRWIPKLEWNKRMKEYDLLRQEQYAIPKVSHKLEFTPGVIGCFSNVHSDTDSKTLKRLFEMVSPVSFVDYQYGEQWGYVRFKTRMGAQLATSYFSRCCIVQQHGKDTGFLDPHRSVKHYGFLVKNQDTFSDAITLYILEGQEEKEYWDFVFESQRAIVEERQMDHGQNHEDSISRRNLHVVFDQEEEKLVNSGLPKGDSEQPRRNSHVVFEEITETPIESTPQVGFEDLATEKDLPNAIDQSNKNKRHLKFDSSDTDQATQVCDQETRKPRHRKRKRNL